MSTEKEKDLVLHYARLAVEDVDNLRTAYGAQKQTLEYLEEVRSGWIKECNKLKGELEATKSQLAQATQPGCCVHSHVIQELQSDKEHLQKRIKEIDVCWNDDMKSLTAELESLKCQASQLLLDKANLHRDLEQAKANGTWHGLQNQLVDACREALEESEEALEQVNKQCDRYMKETVLAEHERDMAIARAEKAEEARKTDQECYEIELETSSRRLQALVAIREALGIKHQSHSWFDLADAVKGLKCQLEEAQKGCSYEQIKALTKELEEAKNKWALARADLESERDLNEDLKKQLEEKVSIIHSIGQAMGAPAMNSHHDLVGYAAKLAQSGTLYKENVNLKGKVKGLEYAVENLQEQLKEASSQLEFVQMLNKKFREGDTVLKTTYEGQVHSNFQLTNMVTDLKVQLLEATKMSDSHHAKATRLEGELSGAKAALGDRARWLEQSGSELRKLDADLKAARKERDDWESQAREHKRQREMNLDALQVSTDAQMALRARVSELTTSLACKQDVIEGLKAKLAARPKVHVTVSHSDDVHPEFRLVGEVE